MQTELAGDAGSKQTEESSAYDEFPYESFPYDYTHPENLCVLGRLFGIEASVPDESRILEIGCASGGNLIPVAIRYPRSECVGIDLSMKQIDAGNLVISDLDLKNIELKHLSIDAVGPELGEFDYIICHGVLSWVSDDIQNSIFEGCKRHLKKNGLAMISYNTLPGWNAVRSVRDMMLYHSAPFTKPNEKVSQSRALLNFIMNTFEEKSEEPYFKVIKQELNILDNTPPSYFFHDHLESENNPMYFHQFCTRVSNSGLTYVSNTDLRSMYTGNYKEEVRKFLEPVANDIQRTEQYLDFISNRRFRSSILCHNNLQVNRNIDADRFSSYCISTDLRPTAPLTDEMLDSPAIIKLSLGGMTLSVGTKLEKSIIRIMADRHYRPIAIRNIAQQLQQTFSADTLEQITRAVSESCLKLLLNGAFTVHLEEGAYVTDVHDKPRTSNYVRYQSSRQAWVTNLRCRKVQPGVLEKILLRYLDGKNDLSNLVEKILEHVEMGELKINENNTVITDKVLLESRVRQLISASLKILAQNALLVDPESPA